MYSVRDRESNTFIKPFCMETDRDAVEGFRVVSNDKESPYNKFPSDYQLIKLGEFDPRTGEVTPIVQETLCWAKDLLKETTEGA